MSSVNDDNMRVIKRNGTFEEMSFDKILKRIKNIGVEIGIQNSINFSALAIKVIEQLYDDIPTTKIDDLLAEQCATLSANHLDYGKLASYMIISSYHKDTSQSFTDVMTVLYNFRDIHDIHSPLISKELYEFALKEREWLDETIKHSRDYLIDYFGFKTLERAYLFKTNTNNKKKSVERIQHMWMRVAIGIHLDKTAMSNEANWGRKRTQLLDTIKETYDLMSQKYFTHATPTLFNAGTPRPQLSSCFLVAMEEDSLEGIYSTLTDCARISKWAGGIGIHIHDIRAKGSLIRGTNGLSDGLVPMLRVFNNTAKYINQGGKRCGSFAMYLEPHHADIEDFLEMRKNHGDEESKARDLFYALWVSDLFMKRVFENREWSLFCPNECPGLSDVYGDDFVKLYEKYEKEKRARKTIKARELWFKILDAQMETGTPYLSYKDAVNKKSNQKNIGVIKSSNLCVAPETKVLTKNGHIEIKKMVGQKVEVWNGEEYSEVEIVQTGTDQELIDVYTDDGSKLTCTPYHKFYIQESYSKKSIKVVEAQILKPNDKIIKCDFPVIDGKDTFLYPYTHGFFCGDGTYSNISEKQERPCKFNALNGQYFCKRHKDFETAGFTLNNTVELKDNMNCQAMSYCKKPMTYLYGDKKKLLNQMIYRSYTENGDRFVLQLPLDIEEKFNIPSYNCSIKDKLDWFAGYCDADGTISNNGDNQQLQVTSINYEFLQNVKLFLQTCGINPKVRILINRDKSYLPDGKGGHKYFDVKPCYRLLITSCDLYKLVQLGFSPKRLVITANNKPSRNANQFIKILKIENNNRIDDTYCFTEPKKHMGVFNGILTSQCEEIVQYSDANETSVCNLASIGLPTYVDPVTKTFDYEKLHEVVKVITNNLNQIIDRNFYPTEKARRSNMRHRPIGIGVQGLADVFILMDVAFHSDAAREINKRIFETIYHAALEKSYEIAAERYEMIYKMCDSNGYCRNSEYNYAQFDWNRNPATNYPYNILTKEEEELPFYLSGAYSSFVGSPASKGILQFDMWGVTPTTNRYDWDKLKIKIRARGVRNSLLVALMPTASTSQILGFNECFEPFTSNIYTRRTSAGEFFVVNKYLMEELIKMGKWNDRIKNNIIANNGSVQQLTFLPESTREKYKIVWEIPMRHLIDMSAERGVYVCQSQSLNLWVEDPDYKTLTSMHKYSWERGLKTGIYYLRRKAKHQAQQFTIEPEKKAGVGGAEGDDELEDDDVLEYEKEPEPQLVQQLLDYESEPEHCEMCSG